MLGRGLESLIPPLNKNPELETQGQKSTPSASGDKFSSPLKQDRPLSPPEVNLKNLTQIDSTPETRKEVRPKSSRFQDPTPIFQIEIEKIKPNPYQPRRDFEEASLKELAESIREYGILQPLIVTKKEKETEFGTEVEYQLVAGERRFLAAKILGLNTLPAIVKTETPEKAKLEMAIIENLQRENLNPIEAARAFAKLQDEFGMTQREIANRIGKSRETVANAVRLLSLSGEVQKALGERKISEGHARVILTVDNFIKQQEILVQIINNNLSVRETERLARGEVITSRSRLSQAALVDPDLQYLKNQLEEALGVKVKLIQYGDRGRITINFFSPEEFQGIIQKLLGSKESNDNLL